MKVLYFVDRMAAANGGIQKLILEILNKIDRTKYKIDILVLDDGEIYPLHDVLKNSGVEVHQLKGIWVRKPFDYFKYNYAVKKFFKNNNDYDIVHLHGSSKNYPILKYAKKYGIKVRIAHSHNTEFQMKQPYRIAIGNCLKMPLNYYATHYFACSDLAGKWLFYKNKNVHVIKNGVDLQKFKYSASVRNKMRKVLDIKDDETAFVNVGRFVIQKNHKFLVEIFKEIYKKNSKAKLFLVGSGDLMDEVKNQVKTLGLEEQIVFLGLRSDVNDILQAMDTFLMPSFHEGFPVVAVEAQSSGLPCLFTDTITKETKIIDEVEFMSLDNTASEWAEKALELIKISNRENSEKTLKQRGFDIVDVVKILENFYSSVTL